MTSSYVAFAKHKKKIKDQSRKTEIKKTKEGKAKKKPHDKKYGEFLQHRYPPNTTKNSIPDAVKLSVR